MFVLFSCSKNGHLSIKNEYDQTIQNVTWGENTFGDIKASEQKKIEIQAGSFPVKFTKSDTLYETADMVEVDARSGATFSLNQSTKCNIQK
jgi:major membrane immunogen (membrane-anchored lipoprotein)